MVVTDDLGQVLILYMRQLSPKVKIIYSKDWGWNWNANTLATCAKSQLIGKDPDAGKDWKQKKGAAEDEMVR